MVRPGVPAPSLAPLLGTDVVRERGGVRYHELGARSLVGRCTSPRVPFDWTANPFRGCAMGCRYCYAAYTHGYLGRDGASEFYSVVYVKTGGEEETRRRLAAAARRGELVALGTATDPYQPGDPGRDSHGDGHLRSQPVAAAGEPIRSRGPSLANTT